MTLRKTTSLTTLLSFILLLATSIILYVTPQGKVAFWANWKILGLDKERWGALHTNIGILFIVAGAIHTILNWKPIVAYLRNRAQRIRVFTADFNAALGATLFIALFTLWELPPVNAIQDFGESIKTAASQKYGEPPYGHAETSSLKSFCSRTGIDLQEALSKLQMARLKGVSEQATLADIALANALSPQQVYALFQPPPPKEGEVREMPESPGMGFGKKTLAAVCKEYGLDEDQIRQSLGGYGIEAKGDATMKGIAEAAGMDPHALYETIRGLQ